VIISPRADFLTGRHFNVIPADDRRQLCNVIAPQSSAHLPIL